MGSSAPIPQRVSQLMSQMTLAQEVQLMTGDGQYAQGYVGSTAPIGSLCIPAMHLEDGPAGVGDSLGGATQLPAPVAAAATWDTSAQQTYGRVVGSEQAAKGTTVQLGPTINIVRDPRWGRAFESIGEDPYLNGQMGAADIRGVQSAGVMAQVKHLAVYNQETNREQENAVVSNQALQEIYLPAFQAAVQQGAASSVMCSYNKVNGAKACENPYLLNTVLRGQFGFKGFVTSDWAAIQSTTGAVNAGLNQNMPDAGGFYGQTLVNAVNSGSISKATVDTLTAQILTQMFAFGQFDKPNPGSLNQNATTAANQASATQIAQEGTVLLKNNGGALPITSPGVHSVAVIGEDSGPLTRYAGGGSAVVLGQNQVTPYQGIATRAAASGISVTQAFGPRKNGALPDVPASVLHPSSGSGSGLTGAYYANTSLSGTPVATRTDAAVDFNWRGEWGSLTPLPGLINSNGASWSAKWTGTLTPPTTGTYTFSLTSDDGSRLFVNGQPVIDAWQNQAATTRTGTISLTAGTPVTIETDYYQAGGNDASITLGWQPPGTPDPLTEAVAAARNSDIAVVFAGNYEGEPNDLTGPGAIDLSANDNQLISAVAAAGKPTVVVLHTGSAVTMPWLPSVAGVIEAWYAGQGSGTAIANVLFGDYNPSGHLPITFPTSLAQVPAGTPAQWPGQNLTVQYPEGVNVGYRWYDSQGLTPMFPFGYGLSYTTFAFSNLSISPLTRGGSATVTATVTNTGSRAGADVAQLYVTDPAASGQQPRHLEGFARVNLQPGQSQSVSFPLTEQNLRYWNTSTDAWATSTGAYGIAVGDADSAAALTLTGTLTVSAGQLGQPVSVTNPGPQEGLAGTTVPSVQVAATDTTAGQTPAFTATGLPAGVSISSTGLITGTPTTTGTSTVTVTAKDGNGAQATTSFTWTVAPAATVARTGPVTGYASLCLDVRAASSADRTPVQVYTCNGTGAQSWTTQSDGTLRAFGKCLDVNGAGTADGTLVQLYTCNGTGAQNWQPQATGELRNPASGKCLTDPASGPSGTQLVIFSCSAGANQKWTLP
ncbi:glycoside hydrolase family 3 C-terminal domain-containing protein [Kitasatospora sp. NPDC057015]|uniref:glycoside hydrolase family 3 C-terminal domain-containing protein n=1 Tax=Kitasatospora sp. NPDC057015 TaxID=3346001 RepID=UPI00363F1468